MDRLSGLNAAQRAAVSTLSGPLLVLAGAGTGKTRVITVRMAELIQSGVPADAILSVTFTNKAAREMQERSAAMLGRRLKIKPVVTTFHSFCVRVLRQDIDKLGYPLRFAICDRGDQESTARTALRDVRVGDKALRPGDLVNRISQWKMAGVDASQAVDYAEDDRDILASMAYRKYQKALKARGAVDFDDLLLLTMRLFEEFPDVLRKYQSRFRHVQIDEYQDTNGVQFRLIESLVREHRNLCVVGDDDQSIYGWRGAEVTHILGFSTHFPEAKVVRLEENYRCTDKILDLANRLIRHNKGRHDKTLRANKPNGSDVRFLSFPDENTESESVVAEIRYLINELGVQPRDIAILFRTNEQPRVFETEFRSMRVPYILVGGQSFFDRRETRDLMAYLKTLAHPTDELSLLRIINTPARGIGATTAEKLVAQSLKEGRSLWQVIGDAGNNTALPNKARSALGEFHRLIQRYRSEAREAPGHLGEICQRLLKEINYEYEIARQYKDESQRIARQGMLDEFVETVDHYVRQNTAPSLTGFLETVALMGREEESDKDEQLRENSVRLMTLHSAKGLEFPHVYMVGMEENLLPHKRSVDGTAKDIAEERRLAYVGITRAQEHLTLTRAETRMKWGKRNESLPSRFIMEATFGANGEDHEDEAVVTADANQAAE